MHILKSSIDKPAQPNIPVLAFGVLKGYIKHPTSFLIKVAIQVPSFIKKHKKNYPADFLKTTAFPALIYINLIPKLGKKKAFEIVRAVIITTGTAVQQSNFRVVEDERSFKNLIKYQQRTYKEGPTRFNKMEIIEESDQKYEFKITRCMFFDFYSSIGYPELTSAMCSIDNSIFNMYMPEKVTFHRKGIGNRIVDGCKACAFVIEINE